MNLLAFLSISITRKSLSHLPQPSLSTGLAVRVPSPRPRMQRAPAQLVLLRSTRNTRSRDRLHSGPAKKRLEYLPKAFASHLQWLSALLYFGGCPARVSANGLCPAATGSKPSTASCAKIQPSSQEARPAKQPTPPRARLRKKGTFTWSFVQSRTPEGRQKPCALPKAGVGLARLRPQLCWALGDPGSPRCPRDARC